MDSSIISSTFSYFWGQTKKLSLFLEPYQPALATGLITGKVGWKFYKKQEWKNEIRKLNTRIAVVKLLYKSDITPIRRERLRLLLSRQRELMSQLKSTAISCWQIPSLFFDHPGSNVWNSTFNILNRGIQMQEGRADAKAGLLKKILFIAAGTISLLGITASLMRQINWIDKDNQASHIAIGSAFAVHSIESLLMAKNAAVSYFKNRA